MVAAMESIPHIADVERFGGDGPLDLVIEIPHGATQTADYAHYAAQLTSELPADLVDFFHVNTDAGAPELGRAIAECLGKNVLIVRSRIPRTFIDCNRRIDAAPEEFKAGKVTPGLMPWISTDEDRALLRIAYDAYVGLVHALVPQTSAMLMLHTYAPRTVDVEVDHNIVENLRRAYEHPDQWPLRPEVDVISKGLDGTDYAPAEVVAELAQHLTIAHGDTYPLHPSTLAFDYVQSHPGRGLCVEIRRDLLADPWDPFAQQRISPAKVDRLAAALTSSLARWWR